MKTRKLASLETAKEPPTKRHKTVNQQNINKAESLMDSLNDDCLVSIFSNLSVDDLNNSIAICSRRFRKARSSDLLDQTLTGTIILPERSPVRSFFNAISENNWNEVFSGNRTKLKLVGVEHVSAYLYDQFDADIYNDVASFIAAYESRPSLTELATRAQLPGVTVLDASIARNGQVCNGGFKSELFCIFPNLIELDMSYLGLGGPATTADIGKYCPMLTSITLKTGGPSNYEHVSAGGDCFRSLTHLEELCLEGFCFVSFHNSQPSQYLFELCPSIERLSIKDCRLLHHTGIIFTMTISPQEGIIEMVRNHPSLCWLRSDLSAENVAMLQQERPEMAFVSE